MGSSTQTWNEKYRPITLRIQIKTDNSHHVGVPQDSSFNGNLSKCNGALTMLLACVESTLTSDGGHVSVDMLPMYYGTPRWEHSFSIWKCHGNHISAMGLFGQGSRDLPVIFPGGYVFTISTVQNLYNGETAPSVYPPA